jgi:hypothetical protein
LLTLMMGVVLLACRKYPSDKPRKPFVEYQSRRKPRINKLRLVKFTYYKQERRGGPIEQIGCDDCCIPP